MSPEMSTSQPSRLQVGLAGLLISLCVTKEYLNTNAQQTFSQRRVYKVCMLSVQLLVGGCTNREFLSIDTLETFSERQADRERGLCVQFVVDAGVDWEFTDVGALKIFNERRVEEECALYIQLVVIDAIHEIRTSLPSGLAFGVWSQCSKDRGRG